MSVQLQNPVFGAGLPGGAGPLGGGALSAPGTGIGPGGPPGGGVPGDLSNPATSAGAGQNLFISA